MSVRRIALTMVLAASVAAPLGACANSGYGQKETFGTLGGAALGGLAGSQIGSGSGKLAATAVGVVLGGLLGNQVGRRLDDADRLEAERSARYALESSPDGQQYGWRNPNSGNYGYTTPTATYQGNAGQWCRQYQTTIVVDGQAQTGTGNACRQPDGTWQIVS
jgi:surface antigen